MVAMARAEMDAVERARSAPNRRQGRVRTGQIGKGGGVREQYLHVDVNEHDLDGERIEHGQAYAEPNASAPEPLGERQRLLQMWQDLVEQVAFAPAERLGIGRTVEAKREGTRMPIMPASRWCCPARRAKSA